MAKSVFVSAGHSGVDPGAVGFGRKEADIAVEMRNIVSFYLAQFGVKHELDGKGTENLPLNIAAARAKNHPLAVEFHCNASSSETATGCEVLCAPKDSPVAAKICATISEIMAVRNRGVKPENSGQHNRLAFVRAGGMIVELFFITNRDDLAAYDRTKWLVGRGIAYILREACS